MVIAAGLEPSNLQFRKLTRILLRLAIEDGSPAQI